MQMMGSIQGLYIAYYGHNNLYRRSRADLG